MRKHLSKETFGLSSPQERAFIRTQGFPSRNNSQTLAGIALHSGLEKRGLSEKGSLPECVFFLDNLGNLEILEIPQCDRKGESDHFF